MQTVFNLWAEFMGKPKKRFWNTEVLVEMRNDIMSVL